jgi:broad specificity phosphatase PhoE
VRLGLAVTFVFLLLARDAAAQKAIVLVRHAEKAIDSNEPGVPLSEEGQARAERLADTLKNAGVTAIYATDTERARRTAEPLARALRLDVRIYEPRDASGKPAPRILIDRLRKEEPRGIVLVVGHANTVPDLLSALGHAGKIEIPSTRYDDLFIAVPKPDGVPAVLRLRY